MSLGTSEEELQHEDTFRYTNPEPRECLYFLKKNTFPEVSFAVLSCQPYNQKGIVNQPFRSIRKISKYARWV